MEKQMSRIVLASLVWLCASSAVVAADFDIKNADEFKKIIPEGAKVQKEASGFGFVEGPTWVKSGGGYLVFSDIPNSKIMKWTAKNGVTVFRADSKNSNGNTTDPDGLLVRAHHGSRSVTRTEKDGKITTLADKYNEKPLNSPNDVVVKSDGTIWFTDPDYGIPKGRKRSRIGTGFIDSIRRAMSSRFCSVKRFSRSPTACVFRRMRRRCTSPTQARRG